MDEKDVASIRYVDRISQCRSARIRPHRLLSQKTVALKARGVSLSGRFRHWIFFAFLFEALAAGSIEDRPVLCARRADCYERCGDRQNRDRAWPMFGFSGNSRGRRNRSATGLPVQRRMSLLSGIFSVSQYQWPPLRRAPGKNGRDVAFR